MQPFISVDLLRAASRSDSFPSHWDQAKKLRALGRYKKFLQLAASNPGVPLAPSRDIDEMWHLHMLHPRAYYEDCKRMFGHILDHDGGFGKDPAELPELKAVFEETSRLWKVAFAEDYMSVLDLEQGQSLTSCWHDCQGRCWHACKGGDDDD